MSTNILKNTAGDRVVIGGAISVKISSFVAYPDANTIRFTGQGIAPIIIAYADLKINSVQVSGQSDAITKLNTYIPGMQIVASAAAAVDIAPKKYYGLHVVVSLSDLDVNGTTIQAYVQLLKDSGFNVLWVHVDDYDPSNALYKTNLLAFITACEAVGGIWVIPGLMNLGDTSTNTSTKKCKAAITDTWERKGVLKIKGKQVYCFYNYYAVTTGSATFDQIDLNNLLLVEEGILKSQWLLIANSQYPYSYDVNRVTWQGETTLGSNGLKTWSIQGFVGTRPVATITDQNHLLDRWPDTDGLAVFGVGTPLATLRGDNMHKARVAKFRNLQGGAWAGFSGFYASYAFYDFGYSGLVATFQDILDMNPEDRPIGFLGATANDDIEYSRLSALPGFNQGLKYIPTTGTYIGNTLPTPVLDRRGMTDLIRPMAYAYINDLKAPVYLKNQIFCWYMLHPKGAAFISTIDSGAVDVGYTQTQWNSMIYKVGNHTIDDGAGNGIKFMPNVDNIRMAAHLVQGSYKLKINSTLSAQIDIPAGGGIGFHEIAIGSFTGTPVFSIYAADGTTLILTANGPQDITTKCWPGGWGILALQLTT